MTNSFPRGIHSVNYYFLSSKMSSSPSRSTARSSHPSPSSSPFSTLSLNDRYKTVGAIFSNSAFTETLSLSLFKSGCNLARNAQCIDQLRAPSRLLANALSIASDITSGFEQTQRQSFSRSRAGGDGTDHLACARVAGGLSFGH